MKGIKNDFPRIASDRMNSIEREGERENRIQIDQAS